MRRIGLAVGLLSFLSEAGKAILLIGSAVSWLGFVIELRELMHIFGLAVGLLGFLSEAEKAILLNGLAVGWLGFQTELRELMH